MTDQPIVPMDGLSPDAPRKEQRAVIRKVESEIVTRLTHAKEVAAENYELGLAAKRDIITKDIQESQAIARMFKQQAKDYLGISPTESVENDVERIHSFDKDGEWSTVRHKSMSGELRARSKLVDTAAKIDKTIADTVDTLLNTAAFMGERNINIQKNEYSERINRTSGQSAEVVEGEVVDEVDEELRGIIGEQQPY